MSKLGPRFDAWLTTPPDDDGDDFDPIHAAGWDAAENGEPLGNCPYLPGTDGHERWVMGWADYREYITWKTGRWTMGRFNSEN